MARSNRREGLNAPVVKGQNENTTLLRPRLNKDLNRYLEVDLPS